MRKRFIVLLIICLVTKKVESQTIKPDETANLANLCKVWGFLKYYHPSAAKGTLDFDSILLNLIPKIRNANKQQQNIAYTNLLEQLGTVPIYSNFKPTNSFENSRNLDLKWLSDTRNFTPEIIFKLNFIKKYTNQDSNYYVSGNIYAAEKYWGNPYFKNEKPYKAMRLPDENYRLLSLFRFWNIIEYYYPYKYSLEENWDSNLKRMISVFMNAKDTLSYDQALRKLVYSIHDSHSDFTTRKLEAEYGNFHAPFYCEIVEGKAVVTRVLDDSICNATNLKIGDIVNSWNNEKITLRLRRLNKEIPACNLWTRYRDICLSRLLASKTEVVPVIIRRDGKTMNKKIFCIGKVKAITALLQPKSTPVAWSKINTKTGYVHLASILDNDVDSMMSTFKYCDAIIFDIRSYPKGSAWFIIAEKYLYPEKRDFAMMMQPNYSYPGMTKEVLGEDAIWKNVGFGKNPNCFKGKIVVLINEQTQSQAEFAVMAFQAAPAAVTIGSTTAGTNGDISVIPFVGGLSAKMSGIGVYYPNGRETQRVGIKPDIEVKRTIKGITSGKDELLDAAVKWILNLNAHIP